LEFRLQAVGLLESNRLKAELQTDQSLISPKGAIIRELSQTI